MSKACGCSCSLREAHNAISDCFDSAAGNDLRVAAVAEPGRDGELRAQKRCVDGLIAPCRCDADAIAVRQCLGLAYKADAQSAVSSHRPSFGDETCVHLLMTVCAGRLASKASVMVLTSCHMCLSV